jgi:DNA alkylation repair enzyme
MGTPMATPATAGAFLARLEARSSPVERDKLRRYLRAGEGADPTADVVIGVRMGEVFALAKEFIDLPPDQLDRLLASPSTRSGPVPQHHGQPGQPHPHARAPPPGALRAVPATQRPDQRLGPGRHQRHQVPGAWLLGKPRDVPYELARSPRWWERRIAVFATLAFVRAGDLDDTFTLAEVLVHDPHDLVRKVVGGCCARRAGRTGRGCWGSWTAVRPRRRGCCCGPRPSTWTPSSGRTTSA